MIILKWCIPDMSGELRDRIRREAYITNEIIIKQETLRAQGGLLRKYIYICYCEILKFGECRKFLTNVNITSW